MGAGFLVPDSGLPSSRFSVQGSVRTRNQNPEPGTLNPEPDLVAKSQWVRASWCRIQGSVRTRNQNPEPGTLNPEPDLVAQTSQWVLASWCRIQSCQVQGSRFKVRSAPGTRTLNLAP